MPEIWVDRPSTRQTVRFFVSGSARRCGAVAPPGEKQQTAWRMARTAGQDRFEFAWRLSPGDQAAYVFDFGDDWTNLCTTQSAPAHPSGDDSA